MYQIGPKFRYVFRSLALLGAFVAVFAVACAAAFPYLVKGRAVRESIVRNLSAWSGGPVTINGPIRVESFFDLAIEAKDVHLSATSNLAPVSSAEAASVKAVATFSGLLRGKIEFKKVTVNAPKLVLHPDLSAHLRPGLYGLDTIDMGLAWADRSPFPDLVLKAVELQFGDDARTPLQSFRFPEIRVSKGVPPWSAEARKKWRDAPKAPFNLSVKGETVQATFLGSRNTGADAVMGYLTFASSSEDAIAGRIRNAVVPWETSNDIALSGEFSSSSARIALDNATIRFGNSTAKGSVAIALSGKRGLLEGTLAYDALDLTALVSDARDGRPQLFFSSSSSAAVKADAQQTLDLDLRISAERLRAKDFEAGPFAIALTSQPGRTSADIAELGLFGGTVSGRLEHNPIVSPGVSIKLRGTRIEAASLAGALSLPLPLRGPAGFSASLEAPAGNSFSSALLGAIGSFKIMLPYGGVVEGEASRRLSTALDGHDPAWPSAATSSLPLSQANVSGTIDGGGVAATVEADSGNIRLFGSLTVALPGYALSGSLLIGQTEGEQAEPVTVNEHSPREQTLATLMISGTAAAPDFALTHRANLSN